MTIPYTFANATGTIPLQELDDNFANVYQYVVTAGNVVNNTQANITSVGVLNSLSVSGNVGVIGNVTGNYILGNGTFLTGMYGNSNVENYLPNSPTIVTIQSGLATTNNNVSNTNANVSALSNTVANISAASGNIDTGLANTNANVANLTSSLANTNANVSNVYTSLVGVTNTTANNSANIATLQGQVYANSNAKAYLSTYDNTVGNISGFTFSSKTGNTPYILQGNSSAYLLLNSPSSVRLANDNGPVELWGNGTVYQFSVNALTTTANISVTGNITAANFAGNGWQISNVRYSNIYGAYGNADVAVYLANTNIGITTTGNISASRFLGNGSQLTNLPAAGSNSEIQFNNAGNFGSSNNLTYNNSLNQLTVGNVITSQVSSPTFANLVFLNSDAAGGYAQYYWTLSGSKLFLPTSHASDNVTGLFSNVSNIRLSASTANLTLQTNGVITLPDGAYIANGGLYAAANSSAVLGYNGNIQAYASNTGVSVQTYNGSYHTWNFNNAGNLTLPGNASAVGNITANYFIGDGSRLTNINAGNISGSYGNANVAAYLPTYTGNVSANYFIGDGSLLTSLPAPSVTYDYMTTGNIDVMLYDGDLKYTSTVTITPSSGNINTGGNITAGHFIGNGSQLTDLPSGNTSVLSNSTATLTLGSDGTLLTASSGTPANFVVNNTTPDIDLRTASGSGLLTQGNVANIISEGNVTVTAHSHNWIFAGDATLTFPRDVAGNTDPYLVINGGSNPRIQSIDVSQEGPANLEFQSNFAIFSGYNGNTVSIYADDGEIASSKNIQLWTNAGNVNERSWNFDINGGVTFPDGTVAQGDIEGTGNFGFEMPANIGFGILANAGSQEWAFGADGNLTAPGSITMGTGNAGVQLKSNTDGFGIYDTITNITSGASNVIVTLADAEFPGPVSGTVTITGVVGETEANGFWGWQAVEVNEIQLYTDATLSTPVDGTTWSAYVSGGLAVSSGYTNLDIQGGSVAIISGAGQYWAFDPAGNLTLPSNTSSINYANGAPYGGGVSSGSALVNGTNSFSLDNTGQAILTLANISGNIGTIQSISGAPDLLVDALTGNVVIAANDNREWKFDTIGSLTLPTLTLSDGDEQTIIQSQRKIIPPGHWSVPITGTTPTVVYTATDSSITSMKVTMQVQHAGQGMELFEVFATFVGSTDTYYVVNNRVAPPTIADSTVEVSLNSSTNAMEITVTINSGAGTSWVTYDAVEFGIPND